MHVPIAGGRRHFYPAFPNQRHRLGLELPAELASFHRRLPVSKIPLLGVQETDSRPMTLIGHCHCGRNAFEIDGAPDLLKAIGYRFPWLRHVFADGGYAGDKLRSAHKGQGDWTIEIIKRSDTAKGPSTWLRRAFEVLPRRWVVERAFAWIGRCRRLAKDSEQSISSATAWTYIANLRTRTRQLARYC